MLQLIELMGVIVFAVSGIVEAKRKRLDLVGIFVVAFITAFGGGTLRDLLLDRTPLFWVQHEWYLALIMVLAVVSIPLRELGEIEARHLLIPDAIGLGLFSITGAGYALEAGTGWLAAAVMGVITGTWGGVFRDIIINEIPFVFRNTYLYATSAFVGCWIFIILSNLGVSETMAVSVGTICIAGIRIASLRWNIRLPGGH